MPGRVNKMRFKHMYSTLQGISVQTHQCLMLIDFNFAKILKHSDRPLVAAFACSIVSWLRVKTELVRTGPLLLRYHVLYITILISVEAKVIHTSAHIPCLDHFPVSFLQTLP